MKGEAVKRILALFICVCIMLAVTSCSGVKDVTISDSGFTIEETNIKYLSCGRAVFAVNVGDVFAKDGSGNEYCEIVLEDANEFLCDNDKDLPYVYRSADLPEITAVSFAPIAAQLWLEGTGNSTRIGVLEPEVDYLRGKNGWSDERCDKLENDRLAAKAACEANNEKYYASYDYVYLIRDTIANDEVKRTAAPSVNETDVDFTLHIRLLSDVYQGLYYEVVFWRDMNGVNYLLDRGTGYSYLCPYALTYYFWENMTE